MNTVVDDYNEIRPWLDKEMGQFGLIGGPVLNIGMGLDGFWMDLKMAFRSQTKKATGTPPSGMKGHREFKLMQNAFSWNVGFITGDRDGGIGFGLRSEFGGQKFKTRVYNDGAEKGDWSEIFDDLMLNMGPMVKVVMIPSDGPTLTFASYYVFGLFENNMTEIAAMMNNNLDPYGDYPRYENPNGIIGFNITIGGALEL